MNSIPTSAIASMAITSVFGILVPVLLLIVWRVKTKCKMMPALVGAIIFVVFALGLESIPKLLFYNGATSLSLYVLNHTWAYTLIGCLLAGIFEETGRFVAFRFFLKKHDATETSVTYGIGHGGIESILLLGFTMISNISLAVMVNSGAMDALLPAYTDSQAAALTASVDALAAVGAMDCVLAILERVFAITLHISLSVFVFSSVKEKGKRYLFPLAILVHALFDAPAALYQCSVLTLPVCEAILAALSIAVAIFAVRIYKNCSNK